MMLLLLIAVAQPPAQEQQPPAEDGYFADQYSFLEAMALLEAGHHRMAAAKLRALFAKSPTPRVRLELARALTLIGDLKEARQLFIDAYNDDPPPAVKANIQIFLAKIDQSLGKITYGAGAGFFANPLQQPGSYSFSFGGIDLTYEADSAYRNLWGASLSGGYQKRTQGEVLVSANATYRELPGTLADRLTAEVSALKKLKSVPVELVVGVVRFSQAGQSFTLPFAQATYNKSLNERQAVQPSLRVGYYAADAGSSVSGFQAEAAVPFVYAPTVTQTWVIGPSLLRHRVEFAEQSYISPSLRAGTSIRTQFVNIDAGLQGRFTRFDAVDPFWGRRREDKGVSGWVSLSADRLRVGPFLPALGLSCDRTSSTISYYRRRGCDASFELRQLF